VEQYNFSLCAAPSKSVLEGVKAKKINMSQGKSRHPLTLIVKQGWLKFGSLGF